MKHQVGEKVNFFIVLNYDMIIKYSNSSAV